MEYQMGTQRRLDKGMPRSRFAVAWDDRLRRAFPGDRVEVRICYCSFLGECWTSRAGLDHDRVEQCPVPADPGK